MNDKVKINLTSLIFISITAKSLFAHVKIKSVVKNNKLFNRISNETVRSIERKNHGTYDSCS